MANELTAACANELLSYDVDTGIVTWKQRSGRGMPGQKVGSKGSHGYLATQIEGKRVLVHRLIWLMMTGDWPNQVDHIDRNRQNNKWANLRDATVVQNMANRTAHKDNKIGMKGVVFHEQTGKWRARLWHNGKSLSLGLHDTPQQAALAYNSEASRVHGEFARQS